MHQYLVRQGYWSYIEGAHETQPNPTHADYPAWEQAASRVLYCLASCVHDHMLGYIREAKMPKQVWENLKKIFAANTAAQKLQLRQELNNLQQRDMSITSYTLKIKELCDAIGSINVIIDDDEMVQICLGGLAPRFGSIRSAILARENPPSFFDLQSLLLVEENHVRQRNNTHDGQMLYSNFDGGRGHGRRRRGRFSQGRHNHERNPHQWQVDRSSPREFGGRGNHYPRPRNRRNPIECGYCGKLDHYEEECQKKKHEAGRQLINYASNSDYDDCGGMFIMKHEAHSMSA